MPLYQAMYSTTARLDPATTLAFALRRDMDCCKTRSSAGVTEHRERMTATDRGYEEQAKALSDSPPQTWHLLPTDPDRH